MPSGKENVKSKYDVIIIGAGIGGLICGSYLAKNKLKVLIVEKHYQAGGCCTSFRRKGFVFDSAAHLFGSCGNRQMFGIFLSHLTLGNIFKQLDPTDSLNFPDETINIPKDIDCYIKFLQNRFPEDKEGIKSFFKELLRISYHEKRMHILEKYQNSYYGDFLNSFFKSNRLKTILTSQCIYLATEPKRLSTIAMGLMLNSYLKDGAFYPMGGVQSFVNEIVKKYIYFGGHIKLNADVKEIRIKNGIANGIVCENGDNYTAKIVVSNCDASKTFTQFINEKEMDELFICKIATLKKSYSYFCDYLGVDSETKDLQDLRGWHFTSYDMNEEFFNAIYIFVPNAIDVSLAPKGKSIVEVFRVWKNIDDKYMDFKQRVEILSRDNMARLEQIKPGITNKVIMREMATPYTIEKYTANSDGAVSGWEMSPTSIFKNRLDFKTPIENLFLVGHWTNPGGGIASVALSGFILANNILNRKNSPDEIK